MECIKNEFKTIDDLNKREDWIRYLLLNNVTRKVPALDCVGIKCLFRVCGKKLPEFPSFQDEASARMHLFELAAQVLIPIIKDEDFKVLLNLIQQEITDPKLLTRIIPPCFKMREFNSCGNTTVECKQQQTRLKRQRLLMYICSRYKTAHLAVISRTFGLVAKKQVDDVECVYQVKKTLGLIKEKPKIKYDSLNLEFIKSSCNLSLEELINLKTFNT